MEVLMKAARKDSSVQTTSNLSSKTTEGSSQQETITSSDYEFIPDGIINIADGINSIYEQVKSSEDRLKKLDTDIQTIKALLKPVSQIERRRGVKPKLMGGKRPYYKSLLKQLEAQRFVEADHWKNLMMKLNDTVRSDVKRAKSDLQNLKAKSPLYIKKNLNLVSNRFRNLFHTLSQVKPSELTALKNIFTNEVGDKLFASIKAFLTQYDEGQFLSTMYSNLINRKDIGLLKSINQIASELLVAWNEGDSNFSFIDAKRTK